MMFRVAWRSLLTRPIRAAVLAAGFGFGIAVMAELLGVGQVILEQAHAPALVGGGDLVVSGPFGLVSSARYVISTLRHTQGITDRIHTMSVTRRSGIFLITPKKAIPVSATGGIPSLEKAIGDPEVSGIAAWTDAPGDERWSKPERGDVLRAMDRFHPIPDASTPSSSWAEWLYFNGRTPDGRTRVYVTFMVGPPAAVPGKRGASVHVQLHHAGHASDFSTDAEIDEEAVLATAPDMDIAGNTVRLQGTTYHLTLRLPGASGEISVEGGGQHSLPPASIRGAAGWVSGYVVPVLSGRMSGTLRAGSESIDLADAVGYHDHNWGFWEGVRWQWGQVAHDGLSVLYGRLFPPSTVADPERIPGFLAVLGQDGPLGFSSTVTIKDENVGRIEVRAERGVDLRLSLTVDETVRSSLPMLNMPGSRPMDFLQMGGTYQVRGKVGERTVDFTARGSAETFKPR